MIKKWIKIKEQPYKTNFRKLTKVTFKLPDRRLAHYDISGGHKIVSIFPLTKDNKIILVKQFRPGPQKVTLELPAGGVEKNETVGRAALRELAEETGYIGELIFIGKKINSAYSKSIRYNFLAKNCVKGGNLKPDLNEFLEPVLLPLKAYRKYLKSTDFTDSASVASSYLAMDYLNLL